MRDQLYTPASVSTWLQTMLSRTKLAADSSCAASPGIAAAPAGSSPLTGPRCIRPWNPWLHKGNGGGVRQFGPAAPHHPACNTRAVRRDASHVKFAKSATGSARRRAASSTKQPPPAVVCGSTWRSTPRRRGRSSSRHASHRLYSLLPLRAILAWVLRCRCAQRAPPL